MNDDEVHNYTPPVAQDAASDYGYQPPVTATSNHDATNLAALVERLVQERLAAAGVAVIAPVKVLSPEEQARAALDNKGLGLGIDERFGELYRHLDTIAKKVGV
jgi:hypothetical protein